MLKCRDVEQRADELVDGTPLSFRERFALRLHLMMCHHCRRYVKQLRKLVRALRRDYEPASREEVDRILNAVEKNSAQ
jgi:anti-sigma factor RsiW